MNEEIALERMLQKGEPLIELLSQFPGAHSLHSRQAETVSRGQWNLHALRYLIGEVDTAIHSGKAVLSGTVKKLYERAKSVYEKATRAEESGITVFGYAPTLNAYQTASR